MTPINGGADRDRTGDPLLAKQVLSQLSYSPSLVLLPGEPCQGLPGPAGSVSGKAKRREVYSE